MGYPALEVPEILYAILINLSQQDLLVSAQRVCRKWHNLVAHTQALQEALFLRPSSSNDGLSTGLEFNPLLQSRFPGFFDGLQYQKTPKDSLGPWNTTDWARGLPHKIQKFDESEVQHPETRDYEARVLQHREFQASLLQGRSSDLRTAKVQLDLPDQTQSQGLDQKTAARLDAYARCEASWRRMVPCRPAPTELQMHRGMRTRFPFVRSACPVSRGELRIINFGGAENYNSDRYLTFGLLYDIAEDAWCEVSVRATESLRIDYFGSDYMPGNDVDSFRQGLRDAFPNKSIGGHGTVVVHLDRQPACNTYHRNITRSASKMWRNGRLRSEGRMPMDAIVWDERLQFSRTPT